MLDILVAIILFDDAKEDKLVKNFDQLRENVLTLVHCSLLNLAAKVQIQNR